MGTFVHLVSTISVSAVKGHKDESAKSKTILKRGNNRIFFKRNDLWRCNIARQLTNTNSSHIVSRDPSFACWFLGKALLMLGMKSIPETLELFGKRPDQIFLLWNDLNDEMKRLILRNFLKKSKFSILAFSEKRLQSSTLLWLLGIFQGANRSRRCQRGQAQKSGRKAAAFGRKAAESGRWRRTRGRRRRIRGIRWRIWGRRRRIRTVKYDKKFQRFKEIQTVWERRYAFHSFFIHSMICHSLILW